jgi:uncharacterized protein with GYD domain
MPKYMAKATFTPEGLKALREGGAVSRLDAGRALASSMGGTMECYYFAFGDYDSFAILDLPDDEAAAAASIAANVAGAAKVTVTKLLTAEQVDAAFTRTVDYRPPGR